MHAFAAALRRLPLVFDVAGTAAALSLAPDAVNAAMRVLLDAKWAREFRGGLWKPTEIATACDAELEPVSDALPAYAAFVVRV